MYQLKKSALSAAFVAFVAICGTSAAQAETSCKVKNFFAGVTTVTATATGSATDGDFAECTATYQCPAGANKVQVYAFGKASSPGAVLAVENFALSTDGSESVLSDCEALARQGGRSARFCAGSESQLQSPTATLQQAQCTAVAGTPANSKIVATATCICDN